MLRFLTVFFPLLLIAGPISGQAPAAPDSAPSSNKASQNAPASSAPSYTLRASTRVVLTDVTITDAHGNPVHGLDRSLFRIFDNNHPQQLSSFEEHTPQRTSPAVRTVAADPSTFSNDYLLHAPAASNVLFLDTTNLGIVDQMYLNEQLEKFIPTLPTGEPIAVYARAGEYTLLLQNFTDDHERLLAAIHKAIPHLPKPDARDANDYQTLQQIILYLGQIPGRKNVLWFSGGSNFFLTPDATSLPVGFNLQPVYDALEASRIAIYPIDARGLTSFPVRAMFQQQGLMSDVAKASGGQAFYNNNGLSEITAHVLSTDTSFYTLTYTPQNIRRDNKWHKVKVQVEGASYNLSYRRGYFDDGSSASIPTDRPRTLLRAKGETDVLKDPDAPIVFRARVLPQTEPAGAAQGHMPSAPPKKNEVAYSVHFTAPVDAFLLHSNDGKPQVILGAGTLAFNLDGRSVARIAQQFSITLDPVRLKAAPHGAIDFDQQINLPKGQAYLYLAVWDTTTGRLGTIQLPLEVNR